MSLQLISGPERQASYWNAAWHPVIFRFQRQDAQITGIVDNIGTGQGLEITVDEELNELEVGHQIYISYTGEGDPNTVLIGLYAVTSVTVGIGETDIGIDTDTEVVGSFGAGYINLSESRSFYKMQVRINIYTGDGPSVLTENFASFTPSNSKGDIKVDIQSWLQLPNVVNSDSEIDYSLSANEARNLGKMYTFDYREYWREEGFGDWVALGQDYGVVNAVKQIGDEFGQNVGEFVTFQPVGFPQTNSMARFLTSFTSPWFFVSTSETPGFDYPFDLAFILSENIVEQSVFKVERTYDINGNLLNSVSEELVAAGTFDGDNCMVYRFTLDGNYNSNVHRVDVSLFSDSVSVNTLITETKSIFINRDCDIDPIMLMWLNKKGGFDYWVFRTNKQYSQDSFDEVTYEQYVEDLETSQGKRQTLSVREQSKIVMGCSTTVENLQALKDLRTSPKVYMLTGFSESGEPTWVVVNVDRGMFFVSKSGDAVQEISFQINLPETYVQNN